MLKLKVVHIKGPLDPYLTLWNTDVVTWPTMRGLTQPSPVGNRVKRTRPIQASPFYHHQLVHLYLRIFNFSFSSVFSGRGLRPLCGWATPIQSTVVVFVEFCPQIITLFCAANYWNLIGMIALKLLIWFCYLQSKKKL